MNESNKSIIESTNEPTNESNESTNEPTNELIKKVKIQLLHQL